MLNACGLRAISNGMVTPTLFPWRPALVRGRTPNVVSGSVYEADLNLQCGASRHGARNAVCRRSLSFVKRVDAYRRRVLLLDGTALPIDHITDIQMRERE